MSDSEGHEQDPDEIEVDMDIDTDSEDDEMFHMAEDIGVGPAAVGPLPAPEQLLLAARRLNSYHELFNVRRFIQDYRVLCVSHLENRGHQNLESGGKVILPPSALQQLSRNSSALMTPMMFKASNPVAQRYTHCGVLEFIAEEDLCYMPRWMMENLGLADYDLITVEKVELPTATFAKFQPQSVDFLEISNPKAILENSLRFFSCLTRGDMVAIHYNSRVYKLCVLETKPSDAVNITECDLNVDFAAPLGYVSPSASKETVDEAVAGTSGGESFVPFMGSGNRLNGKTVDSKTNTTKVTGVAKGAPDTDWKIGTLKFKRKFAKASSSDKTGEGEQKFRAFGGTGLTLKNRRDDISNDSLEL